MDWMEAVHQSEAQRSKEMRGLRPLSNSSMSSVRLILMWQWWQAESGGADGWAMPETSAEGSLGRLSWRPGLLCSQG